MNSLVRDEVLFIRHETRLYFRDCYDQMGVMAVGLVVYFKRKGGSRRRGENATLPRHGER